MHRLDMDIKMKQRSCDKVMPIPAALALGIVCVLCCGAVRVQTPLFLTLSRLILSYPISYVSFTLLYLNQTSDMGVH
jgi:hypothetical protein